jgi:RHS repeat-associated protein
LSSILVNNITTQYTYDINNRRVSKASGTNSTAYTYAESIGDGSTAFSATSLLGEYTATATKEYVYLGDTPIAVVQSGNILTVQTDHLDTPRQLTDNTKKVIWNWAYSAFGENQPTNTNNTVFNLRYPGQYYDAESKLHYNINRYYDPATGRYTQSDPIGLSGGINTYTYVGGNSIRWSDRTGLIPPLVVGAYIFAVENAVTITGLVVAAAEIASGIPNPVAGELNAIKGAVCTAKEAALLNAVNTGKRTGSSAYKSLNINDFEHYFSNIVDNYASYATKFPLKGGDGVFRDLYQIQGSLKGRDGIFEWIVDGTNVTHRRFITNGQLNGIPNQIIK